MYSDIAYIEQSDMQKFSGCKVPCHYVEYNILGQPVSDSSETNGMRIWMATKTVIVEREELIFPFQSRIADVGGILGLFLGLSFLSFFDLIESAADLYKSIKHQTPLLHN